MDLKYLLLVLYLTCCLQTLAQINAIDSLQQLAAKEQNVEKKVFLLYETVDLQSEFDSKAAYETLNQARTLAGENKYLQAFDPFYEAQIIWMSDTAKAKHLYQMSIQLLKPYSTNKALQTTARAWHNCGIFLQINSRQDEFASILLNKVIPLSERIGDLLSIASAYNAIGTVYSNKEDYGNAITYFRRGIRSGLKGAPSARRSRVLADAYTSIAGCMTYLKKKPDEVKQVLDTARQYLGQVGDPVYHGDYYLNYGRYYEMRNDYSNALLQFNKGLEYAGKSPTMTISGIRLAYEKANALKYLQRYKESKLILDSLLTKTANDFSLNNRTYILKLQAEVEAELGDYRSAYHFLKASEVSSDSLHAVQEKVKIAEIYAKFDVAEQENKILKLENANRQKQSIIVLTVLILLLSAAIFFILLHNRRRRSLQQLKLLSAGKEVAVKNALIYGEEQERKRLARELHDGLGGTFAGIKLKLENAVRKPDIGEINEAIGLLEGAIREFRQTTHRLVPDHLKNNGLENNIKDFCHSFRGSGVGFHFYFKGLEILRNSDKELVIFRIIQELITNAIRHSKAGNILLNCIVEDQLLLLTVEDNGIGFDPFFEKAGLGLNNIRSRISLLNGDIHIDSGKDKGTVVNIEIVL
ncbi:sensor histidine kinase [Niabella beijingensis]|uniref:tetratricopeptide repeat-containing sensor histidine kinase n=1 Tax=Niabella beijingensis TaxID=2872700 RepID=UPI001CBB683F|nr:sensor histidine kinase [Niabella beijingensis]MBZ4189397.1 sensor histidine kinase [Niabella beijingensis]